MFDVTGLLGGLLRGKVGLEKAVPWTWASGIEKEVYVYLLGVDIVGSRYYAEGVHIGSCVEWDDVVGLRPCL